MHRQSLRSFFRLSASLLFIFYTSLRCFRYISSLILLLIRLLQSPKDITQFYWIIFMFKQSNLFITQVVSSKILINLYTYSSRLLFKGSDPISMNNYLNKASKDINQIFSKHVGQATAIIYKIKCTIYQLIDINIGITGSVHNSCSQASILSEARQNIDDLKRIQSLLKGYIASKQPVTTNLNQQIHQLTPKTNDIQKQIILNKTTKQNNKIQQLQENYEPLNKLKNGQDSNNLILELDSRYDNSSDKLNGQNAFTPQSRQDLAIKQLQIQTKFLREQNNELKDKMELMSSQLEFRHKNAMLFSFGKASQSVLNNEKMTEYFTPQILKYKQQIKSSSTKIRCASANNKKCLKLISDLKHQLNKVTIKQQYSNIKNSVKSPTNKYNRKKQIQS